MKKILFLLIIALGIGAFGGNLLTDKINKGDLSWGTAKDKLEQNISDISKQVATSTLQNINDSINHPNDNNMQMMMTQMDADLKDKNGDDFDKKFLEEMIIHHQGAVDMAQQVLQKSKRPELIKLANDIISAQTKEIEMMKSWQTTWFK